MLLAAGVDMYDFKKVNDTHGHGVGDQLLIEFAAREAAFSPPRYRTMRPRRR